jgi:hypothetical protein
MASRDVGFLPRADYERERLYHCQNCEAEFYEDVEQREIHLYEEGGSRYSYDNLSGSWQCRVW